MYNNHCSVTWLDGTIMRGKKRTGETRIGSWSSSRGQSIVTGSSPGIWDGVVEPVVGKESGNPGCGSTIHKTCREDPYTIYESFVDDLIYKISTTSCSHYKD